MWRNLTFQIHFFYLVFKLVWCCFTGKGHYYKFHNVEIPKERWKKFKASERRKWLFSFSLLRNQNIKSDFLAHRYYYNQNIESVFLVHNYYDNQNIDKNIEIDFRCSDFTYGVKKDHNVENQNINTYTYGVLPMVTKACGGLG